MTQDISANLLHYRVQIELQLVLQEEIKQTRREIEWTGCHWMLRFLVEAMKERTSWVKCETGSILGDFRWVAEQMGPGHFPSFTGRNTTFITLGSSPPISESWGWVQNGNLPNIFPLYALHTFQVLSPMMGLETQSKQDVFSVITHLFFFFLQALSSFIPLPFSTNKCFLTSYPVPGTLPAFGDTGHSKCLLWEELSLLGLRHAFYGKEVIDLTSLKGVHSVPSTDWRHNGG